MNAPQEQLPKKSSKSLVIEYLDAHKGDYFTVQDLVAALNIPVKTVGPILSEMAKIDLVECMQVENTRRDDPRLPKMVNAFRTRLAPMANSAKPLQVTPRVEPPRQRGATGVVVDHPEQPAPVEKQFPPKSSTKIESAMDQMETLLTHNELNKMGIPAGNLFERLATVAKIVAANASLQNELELTRRRIDELADELQAVKNDRDEILLNALERKVEATLEVAVPSGPFYVFPLGEIGESVSGIPSLDVAIATAQQQTDHDCEYVVAAHYGQVALVPQFIRGTETLSMHKGCA